MIPTRDDLPQQPQGTTFWTIVIGFWLCLFVVAGTLAIALAIWNLIEAL